MLLCPYLEEEENRILTSISNAYNKEASFFFLLHNLMRRVRRKLGTTVLVPEIFVSQGDRNKVR